MNQPQMLDFLSPHTSAEQVVSIQVEPNLVYIEDVRKANLINFDFVIQGLTDKKLLLKFIKVAVYNHAGTLMAYKFLNHNAVGTPGIHSVGKLEVCGDEQIDIPNPFFSFPKDLLLSHLRYMFTFVDQQTRQEYYYGDIIVEPSIYQQHAKLQVPLKGTMTILDGHDYYSHHRRFEMSLVRALTSHKFSSNFSRYALDFVLIGDDGNLSRLENGEHKHNYDFHFKDVRKFYSHEAPVYAPGDGLVVDIVNSLDDLYETPFNLENAIQNDCIQALAGNYVIIKHNPGEFSHLFHLLKGSIKVSIGQQIPAGQEVGKIGFSGASTTYSHLHYQFLDGQDFLRAQALPCKFSDISLIENGEPRYYDEVVLDSNDFLHNP